MMMGYPNSHGVKTLGNKAFSDKERARKRK